MKRDAVYESKIIVDAMDAESFKRTVGKLISYYDLRGTLRGVAYFSALARFYMDARGDGFVFGDGEGI